MKISSISIKNFRKAENKCQLSINKQTLIVGKNNTSKTSIIEIISKFLINGSTFKMSDFNYKTIRKDIINNLYYNYKEGQKIEFPTIEMEIELKIESEDNLALIKELIYDFENNEIIIIKCRYLVEDIIKIFNEFEGYNNNFIEEKDKIDFYSFFEREFTSFYSKKYYSTKPHSDYLNEIDPSYIYKLFNVFPILAQRNVDDISENDKMPLSNAIWKFYQDKKKKSVSDISDDDIFREAIKFIKEKLDDTYANYFSDLITMLNEEIVNDDKNKKLNIVSDFDIETLLKKNSKVKYFFDEMSLSESSNGLGYSNLLYIYIQLESFKFEIQSNKAPFNIVFIEEPESHLHPQMQSVFLNKINKIFDESNIYSIITTHSSYVLQSSDINNINYFLNTENGLTIRALSNFINDEKYSGLKQIIDKYFVINTCDLFFADKVIFIEGMAERILMPYFFEKYDMENEIKISNQHIAIFEVGGRHAYIFQDLVRFLGLKSLTITDIDSVSGTYNESCPCNLEITDIRTTNPTIKNWFCVEEKMLLSTIKEKYSLQDQCEKNTDGTKALIVFQKFENDNLVCGRTLEEQIIIENSNMLVNNIHLINSLSQAIKNIKKDYHGEKITLNIEEITAELLEKYCFEIVKEMDKSNFAIELIGFEDWKIPTYILEGLIWIAK